MQHDTPTSSFFFASEASHESASLAGHNDRPRNVRWYTDQLGGMLSFLFCALLPVLIHKLMCPGLPLSDDTTLAATTLTTTAPLAAPLAAHSFPQSASLSLSGILSDFFCHKTACLVAQETVVLLMCIVSLAKMWCFPSDCTKTHSPLQSRYFFDAH